MKLQKFSLPLLLIGLFFPVANAQESGLWEKAFARPHGAILVSEILYEPEQFMVRHQGQRIKVAGKFKEPNLTRDGSTTRATIVWGGRYSGVACLSSEREEMLKIVDLVTGEEVLASGIVDRYDGNWLYLDECTIEAEVTLFHSRDPKFILGTWCSVYGGKTQRKLVFTRGDDGSYLLKRATPDRSGGWKPWSNRADTVRVKRQSASTIEFALLGPKYDYGRERFTIVSHNKMSRADGFKFYRCRSLDAN